MTKHWDNTSTAMGRPPFTSGPVNFASLPEPLQGLHTHALYVSPRNKVFELGGPRRGRQGVRFVNQLTGDQQWPFSQVLTNSPYIMGADLHRTNIPERLFQAGIVIGSHNPPMTEYQYRMAADNWWDGQDENNDGWLCMYTRFSGWRFEPVRPFETVKTPQAQDVTAYGNNVSCWDISWLATRPYFTKPAVYDTFLASKAGPPRPAPAPPLLGLIDQLIGDEYYWGTIVLANKGTLPSYVTFLVSSPGQAILQDNASGRLVTMPDTMPSRGTYMCDTEPGHRTLTAADDPVDNLAYDLIRQSKVLDFFLGHIANEGVPLQLTWNNTFRYCVPAKTAVHLTVGHSDPNGTITAILPQRYKRAT